MIMGSGNQVNPIIRYAFLLGLIWIIVGCSQTLENQTTQTAQSKEDKMSLAYKTENESYEIPPIDAAAPAHFETASFGLG